VSLLLGWWGYWQTDCVVCRLFTVHSALHLLQRTVSDV